MKKIIYYFSKTAVAVLLVCCVSIYVRAAGNSKIILSPNKKIAVYISNIDGKFFYQVRFNSVPVIEQSLLSLIVDGKEVITGEFIAKSKIEKFSETYAYRGVHNMAINNYNGIKIITDDSGAAIIEIRVYNDGIAFRYVVARSGSSIVEADNTEFKIPASSILWSQNNIKYYEGRYSKKKIEDFKQGEFAGPPVMIELPNSTGFAAITEGGLTDFAGMSLRANGSNAFHANLSGITNKTGNIETPWRVIVIGKDLNTLVNCDIVANVSPSYNPTLFPQGYNTDWVKPGRSVWSWLATPRAITLANMKHFSDLAAQLGFEYNLVDEGWSNWKDSAAKKDQWDMMKELVDYSATKGVKIWVWKAYPDRGGIPGIKDSTKRREFFKRCKDLGIAGLKVDFFDSESQEIIQFYQAALRDAAEYHLMLDFHGANKPTGETRTWPNEMTRESIRGMENQPPWAPGNTTLPFTRYLAGHADFTPIHFGNRLGEVSWAHHIASMVVFTSPFLCMGADPQSVLDNPAKAMIQSIPSVWDETIVLPQSKIGELVLFARRSGFTWFLAAMNGLPEPKIIDVNLSFLAKGKYQFLSVKDDSTKQANAVLETIAVIAKRTVQIKLNASGGYVGRFSEIIITP